MGAFAKKERMCVSIGPTYNVHTKTHRARRASKGLNVIFLANAADSDNFYTPAL